MLRLDEPDDDDGWGSSVPLLLIMMMMVVLIIMIIIGGGKAERHMTSRHASRYSRRVVSLLRQATDNEPGQCVWQSAVCKDFFFLRLWPTLSMQMCVSIMFFSVRSVVFEILGQIRVTVFESTENHCHTYLHMWQRRLHRKNKFELMEIRSLGHPRGRRRWEWGVGFGKCEVKIVRLYANE